MSCTRASLREEINGRLVPELLRRGFAGPERIAGNGLLHEFRRSSERGTDVLVLQWEKHGRPRFLLLLHVEPPEGLDALVARGGTILAGALTPRRGASSRSWFRADATWWQRWTGAAGTNARDVVAVCLALLPEVEDWWGTPRATAHIAVWPVTYAASTPRQHVSPRG